MLDDAKYRLDGLSAQRRLVAANPWGLLISPVDGAAPVVSHLPVVLDPQAGDLTILSHMAKTDAEAHRLGSVPVTVVVQGPSGYISPAWYGTGPAVPTCDYTTVHLSGWPDVLDAEQTLATIGLAVEAFEAARPEPWSMAASAELSQRLLRHTTGFRLRPTRVQGKAKLSQDKPAAVIGRIVEHLQDPAEPYAHPALAQAILQALS